MTHDPTSACIVRLRPDEFRRAVQTISNPQAQMNHPGKANDKVPLSAAYVAEGTYPADICVLRYALERNARAKPDAIFAAFEGGERWTFAQTLQQVESLAGNLHELGVRQGDHVVLVLPTSPLALRAMFAVNYLGAVYVPVNPALKGSSLEHVLHNARAAFAIVHDGVLDRVLAAAPDGLTTIVRSSDETAPSPPARHRGPRRLRADQTRGAAASPAQTDPAVRSAVDHLHVGHDGPVEGRVVVLHARLFLCRTRRLELPHAPTTGNCCTCRSSTSAARSLRPCRCASEVRSRW